MRIDAARRAAANGQGRTPGARQGPLAGIRVADFCWMGVGACATRLLADFGAEVIRIEDRNPVSYTHLTLPTKRIV